MGWLDYHLHVFRFKMPHHNKFAEIGIPDEAFDDHKILPGWQIPLYDYFFGAGTGSDIHFGENGSHNIVLQGILLKKKESGIRSAFRVKGRVLPRIAEACRAAIG